MPREWVQGDNVSHLVTLKARGRSIDLTGAAVTAYYQIDGGEIVDLVGSVTDGPRGKTRFDYPSDAFYEPGSLEGEVRAVLAGGQVHTSRPFRRRVRRKKT